MKSNRPAIELNHENIPSWVGRIEDGWKFYILSFARTHLNTFFENHDACEARLIDGNRYFRWCRTWNGFTQYSIEVIRDTDKWYWARDDFYRRFSYLNKIPIGVKQCSQCLAVKNWVGAAESLKLEKAQPIRIDTVEQFHNMDGFDPFNQYIFALKDIYFSHFGLTGSGCTLKTLDRRRLLRGRVKALIEEMIALGIVTLHPSSAMKTVYVQYNEKVDIATALDVLSWYGKLHLKTTA